MLCCCSYTDTSELTFPQYIRDIVNYFTKSQLEMSLTCEVSQPTAGCGGGGGGGDGEHWVGNRSCDRTRGGGGEPDHVTGLKGGTSLRVVNKNV